MHLSRGIAVAALVCLLSGHLLPLAPKSSPQHIPPTDNMVKMGCQATLNNDPEHPGIRLWMVDVWVEYTDGHKWKLLNGRYEEKERSKALANCDKWMAAVREAEVKLLKSKNKDKTKE